MSKVWRKLKTKQAHKKIDPQLQKARGKQVGKIPVTYVKKIHKIHTKNPKNSGIPFEDSKILRKISQTPKKPFSIENRKYRKI